MPTVHTREFEWIFSLNKQADFRTPIADGQLNKQRSIRTFAPAREDRPAIVSDRQWFGKGHPFATFHDKIQKWYVIDSQERSATNLEALYGAYFVMGNNVVTQPDTATNPNEYRHTLTWQDLSSNKTLIPTTIVEKMGSEFTKRLTGGWINSVTFSGNRDDHVTMSLDGGAREYEDDVITSPGISTASFFKTLYGTVSFGLADAPALISAEVLSWTVTISQNIQPMWLMGNSAGEEELLAEVLIGDQTVSASVVIKVNTTHRDRFLNDQTIELQIVAKSPDTIDTNPHTMTIFLHNVKIADESWGEEGTTVSYTMNMSEDSVLKTTADEHLTVQIDTDINAAEIGVTA